jgi:hypothetical protein
MSNEPRNATITYPGGLRARWRWGGSGSGPEVFALSEAGGALVDRDVVVGAEEALEADPLAGLGEGDPLRPGDVLLALDHQAQPHGG